MPFIDNINTVLNAVPLSLIFLSCTVGGMAYSFIVIAFGGHGMDDGGGHGLLDGLLGGHDGGGGGAELIGGHVHISFLSPLSLTCFMTGFGAFGLITLNALAWPPLTSIFTSALGGLLLNAIITAIIYKIFISSQGTSLNTVDSVIGLEAEVITAIVDKGVGEITYTTKQGRQTSLAHSLNKESIDRGEIVTIVKFIGTSAYVKKIDSGVPPQAPAAPPQPDSSTRPLEEK